MKRKNIANAKGRIWFFMTAGVLVNINKLQYLLPEVKHWVVWTYPKNSLWQSWIVDFVRSSGNWQVISDKIWGYFHRILINGTLPENRVVLFGKSGCNNLVTFSKCVTSDAFTLSPSYDNNILNNSAIQWRSCCLHIIPYVTKQLKSNNPVTCKKA